MKQNSTFSLMMLAAFAGWTVAIPLTEFPGHIWRSWPRHGPGRGRFSQVDAERMRWLAAGEMMAVIAVPVGAFAVGSIRIAPLDESSLLPG